MQTELSMPDLLKLGTLELVRLYKERRLTPARAWVALKGAAKYRAAVARGDVRTQQEAHGCALKCAGCPSVTWRPILVDGIDGAEAGYCGPDFEDRTDAALPTCGCLTSLRVNGVVYPGGKTMVRGEACPQGRWS